MSFRVIHAAVSKVNDIELTKNALSIQNSKLIIQNYLLSVSKKIK